MFIVFSFILHQYFSCPNISRWSSSHWAHTQCTHVQSRDQDVGDRQRRWRVYLSTNQMLVFNVNQSDVSKIQCQPVRCKHDSMVTNQMLVLFTAGLKSEGLINISKRQSLTIHSAHWQSPLIVTVLEINICWSKIFDDKNCLFCENVTFASWGM